MKRVLMNTGISGVDEHTLLLLKFNENGPIDHSMYNHTITNNGCVFTYPSVDGKGRSVSKNSRSSNLIPDVDFVTQIVNHREFTVECFLHLTGSPHFVIILSKDRTRDVNGWGIVANLAADVFSSFVWPQFDNASICVYSKIISYLNEDKWNHLCITLQDNVSRAFINGHLVKINTLGSFPVANYACRIFGRTYEGDSMTNSAYRMDCLRISDVCRYTEDFTPVYFQP